MKQVREHDLLLMTTEKLDLPGGGNDIKKFATGDLLRSLLIRSCTMFGFVTQRAAGGKATGMTVEGGSLELIVDISKACILSMEEREMSYSKLYVYHFESMASTFREYKTIRMSEFYPMSDILLNPRPDTSPRPSEGNFSPNQSPALENENGAEVVEVTDDLTEDERIKQQKMSDFREQFKPLYNSSQIQVLQKVANMPEHDVLLIQGPPGTGKTHTITGIISMLIGAGVNKIHVCAPSNAAVDEILARMSTGGIHGVTKKKDELKKMFLRIGAMEYDPVPEVKQHTLDERLKESLHDARVYDLKE